MPTNENKIALIIPPSPFLADERVFPSLGILKVASSLEQAGIPVDVLDLSGIGNPEAVMQAYIAQRRTHIFGITSTTPQFPQAVKLRNTIKDGNPASKVIVGGAHPTMVHSAYLLDQSNQVIHRGSNAHDQLISLFDVTVAGDGEQAIFTAIEDDAPKVIDASQRTSDLFLQRGTLDQYPLPNRDLIDLDSYHYQIDGKPAQSMIAQLGCPFECGFCGGRNTQSFRTTRSRSSQSIIEEVDLLVSLGKRGIMLYDDELNLNPETLSQTMEALIRYQETEGLDLRFRGFVKAELFLPDQAQLMFRAGFRELLSGVESGDDGMLKTMRKHTTREINSRWVQNCHKAGIKAKALMSIGHPGESAQTIQNSVQWVQDNQPDEVDWSIITQYPGSPYFDSSQPHPTDQDVWVYSEPRTGNVLYSQDVNYAEKAEYYKGIPGDYTSYVWTDHLTAEQLVELRDQAELITRKELGLPQIVATPPRLFSYQAGQPLPSWILRSSAFNK
jgi:anaerobic magnesium-protoporphyrin IX monomethyl ester cyclase